MKMNLEGIELYAGDARKLKESHYPSGTSIRTILTPDAISFAANLHRKFNSTRKELLAQRPSRRNLIASGEAKFFSSVENNDDNWKGAELAPGLEDRRVEITGPPDRKMIVNALNTPKVCTYMSDFEDSMSPTWNNVINGQINLYDSVRLMPDFKDQISGKDYKLQPGKNNKVPVILVRPRGLHLEERHLVIDEEPISGSIFDFAIYFYHNAKTLINERGWGPYFYLPKLESQDEAKLWNDIFNEAQDQIGIARGTIRATVLIETLSGAYDMEGIIYQLKEHCAGLNCGRWDYIFSTIKTFMTDKNHILPDRSLVTMTVNFMKSYVEKLIEICHKRGVHAMGGMAAQIPIKNDPEANERAMDKVRADKEREVKAGHDGTWVAHPALAPIAFDIFDNGLSHHPHQLNTAAKDSNVTPDDLINTKINDEIVTEQGLKTNIYIGLCYMQAWLCGAGSVPINFLMEDAATAEVSRSQVYQWVLHNVVTNDTNKTITREFAIQLINEERDRLKRDHYKSESAQKTLDHVTDYWIAEITNQQFHDFLTLPLYEVLLQGEIFNNTLTDFDELVS